MTDIAKLGIAIDATDAERAAMDLNNLAVAAGKVERTVKTTSDRINRSFSSLSSPMKSARESAAAMEAEFSRLRSEFDPLYANSMRYSNALDKLNAAHRAGALSAKQHEVALAALNRDFAQVAISADRATASVARTSRVSREYQSRMVTMQLSQVMQHGAVTGNYMQALALQIPDLALAFGPLAIMAGAAAGSLLPLAINMATAKDEAKLLEDAMTELNSAVSGYQSAVELALSSSDDLEAMFGKGADEIRKTLDLMAKLEFANSLDALGDSASAASDQIDEMRRLITAVEEGRTQTSGWWFGRMSEELDLTLGQMQMLVAAFDQLGKAKGTEEAIDKSRRLQIVLEAIYGDVEKAPKEMRALALAALEVDVAANKINASTEKTAEGLNESVVAASDLEGYIKLAKDQGVELNSIADAMDFATAITAATALAERLGLGAGFAQTIAGLLGRISQIKPLNAVPQLGAGQSGMFTVQDYINSPTFERGDTGAATSSAVPSARPIDIDFGYSGNPMADFRPQRRPNDIDFGLPPLVKGGKGGGGGKSGESEVQKTAKAYEKLRRSIDDAYDAQAEFEEGQNILNDALAAGIIDTDEYTEGMDLLKAKLDEAVNGTAELGDATRFLGDALIDVFMEGEDAVESFIKALQRALLQAALLGEGPLAAFLGVKSGNTGILGAVSKWIMGSRDGGGYTWEGPRSGGLDGKGGQLMMMHPNETVVDHEKGQSMGTNIVYSPVIDARGADTAAVQKLAGIVAKQQEELPRVIKSVMRNSGLRGR